jgi:hypothetical protein
MAGSRRTAELPRFYSLLIRCRDLCRRDALKRESIGQTLVQAAAKASRECHACVSQRQRMLPFEIARQFPSTRKERFAINNFVHGAVFVRLRSTQALAGQQKIPAANLTDYLGPHDVQTVAFARLRYIRFSLGHELLVCRADVHKRRDGTASQSTFSTVTGKSRIRLPVA